LRRIADAAFPGEAPSGEQCAGTPLTVAGAAADRRKVYRVPFSPSKARGTVQDLCFSFAEGCQIFGVFLGDRF
jgi:hypothetical protein